MSTVEPTRAALGAVRERVRARYADAAAQARSGLVPSSAESDPAGPRRG